MPAVNAIDQYDRQLDGLQDSLTLRAKSLIVTVLGDVVEAHGGGLWLGNLIALVAPFGVNERLVRTSVLRLSREGWLSARQIGRRSYYELTPVGRQRIRDSGRRIYAGPRTIWDGRWHLVLTGLGEIGEGLRARLRRELRWLGFGALGPNIFAHPQADLEALLNVLEALALRNEVVVMRGRTEALAGIAPSHELLGRAFDLRNISEAYRYFLGRFMPFRDLSNWTKIEPASAFRLRILMSHEFRRVRLRDPALPAELLAKKWVGGDAWTLARELYEALLEASDAHLRAVAETDTGRLPEPPAAYYDRFGGVGPRARVKSGGAK
ncbi:MAG TPA: phenylacetic acid degradation operon negative regulatory protein PaaX [Alphaproteobacteria bacterium]|nr:phenylacetic acid degradation operon negative regulatory protein PaaX [Alphaproteobacteria bacterium]